MKKNKESLQELWDTMKRNNICIMRIPEWDEKETESIFKAIWMKMSQTKRERSTFRFMRPKGHQIDWTSWIGLYQDM